MSDEHDLIERLRARTAGIAPPTDFSDRVMARVERSEREPWAARGIAMGLFAAAAALAIWVSSTAQQQLDSEALSSFDLVELEQ